MTTQNLEKERAIGDYCLGRKETGSVGSESHDRRGEVREGNHKKSREERRGSTYTSRREDREFGERTFLGSSSSTTQNPGENGREGRRVKGGRGRSHRRAWKKVY